MIITILERGFCQCIRETRGEFGLGTFQMGDVCQYEFVDKNGHIFYKVYPESSDNFKTCSSDIFNMYFQKTETV